MAGHKTPPGVPDDPDLEFSRTFAPKKPSSAYEWVLEYAKERLDLYYRLTDSIDAKAESLIRYAGGTAVALAAALPFLLRSSGLLILLFLPSMIGLLLAAKYALDCVRPQEFPGLPAISAALRFADVISDNARVKFFAFAIPLERRLKELIEHKRDLVHTALKCFLAAMLLALIAGVIAGVMLFSPSSCHAS